MKYRGVVIEGDREKDSWVVKFEDGERRERNEKWMKDKCKIIEGKIAEKVRAVVERDKSKGEIRRDREIEEVEDERKEIEVKMEKANGKGEETRKVGKLDRIEEIKEMRTKIEDEKIGRPTGCSGKECKSTGSSNCKAEPKLCWKCCELEDNGCDINRHKYSGQDKKMLAIGEGELKNLKWRLNELEVWKKKYVKVIDAVVDLEKEVKGLKSEKIKEDYRRSEEISREKKWAKKLEELEGQVKILKMTTKIIGKNDKLKEKTEMDENEAKEENRDKERQEPGIKETAEPKGENIQKNKQTREWPKGEILEVRTNGMWWESKIVKEVEEGIVISVPREPRMCKTENKWERETEKYRDRHRENKKESESERNVWSQKIIEDKKETENMKNMNAKPITKHKDKRKEKENETKKIIREEASSRNRTEQKKVSENNIERFRKREEENTPNNLIGKNNTVNKPEDGKEIMNEGPFAEYVKQADRIGGKLYVLGLD